ncbi:ribonucleotide reductase [Aeromonas phage BUCT695]|uniref:ribonucleotide reductase n=1 Tax=Aeromonas phage BUCT695 TaxID=2908630 RepID=UPI0023291F01|nr:ribonucleotide reductase [Aeromonas phage BUCT695]UIW10578.1 hypothetical protein [Aeromonas phage BUCT695]
MNKNAFSEIFNTFKEGDGSDLPGHFEVIEEGEWEVEYKDYATRRTVVREMNDDMYYAVDEYRSGSYYTEFHYDDPVIQIVKPVEKTIIVYEVC